MASFVMHNIQHSIKKDRTKYLNTKKTKTDIKKSSSIFFNYNMFKKVNNKMNFNSVIYF